MKSVIIAVVLLIISSFCASGQIVLEPQVTGNVRKLEEIHSYCQRIHHGSWDCTVTFHQVDHQVSSPDIEAGYWFSNAMYGSTYWVGWTHRFYNFTHGVLEFDLQNTEDGGVFPPPEMTAYNWTARLVDMDCIQHVGDMIGMYNLQDTYEDGVIDASDFGGFQDLLAEGIHFDEVDVTETLRHDLFGSGTGNPTTGFLLKAVQNGNRRMQYDYESPRIEITGYWPTVTPTATPTPEPPAETGVSLNLSQDIFSEGDTFKLDVVFTKNDPGNYRHIPFVLVLDVSGEYFWYPSWSDSFQYLHIDLDTGIVEMTVLDFVWPEITGTSRGIMFHGAMLSPDLSETFGTWDSVSFGWV